MTKEELTDDTGRKHQDNMTIIGCVALLVYLMAMLAVIIPVILLARDGYEIIIG